MASLRLIPTVPFTLLILLITASLSLNIFPTTVRGVPDTRLKDVSCSTETVVGDSYGRLVSGLLNALIGYTPLVPGYVCSLSNGNGTDTVYGFARCAAQLSQAECATCLTAAQQTAYSMCPYAVELVDCYMRYENYKF